ncbi:hypothetical protein [Plantactinospora endophytica]|uniref:Uncharacterized protein n=1 Tax=Plantactinospora endophytica TaxID=673535 RepID=A0ABQ4EEP9_9ACTN|nr:hypothetical protein [Plantactinospora endophytica]GIG93205.1 hypothetical protein Pen02_81410 [Plantactinospora endophytica]
MTTLDAPPTASTTTAAESAAEPQQRGTTPRPLGLVGWPRVVRTLMMAAGAAAAIAVAFSNPDRHEPQFRTQWLLWASVAGLLGALSGSTVGSGVARWHDLQQIQRVPVRRVVPSVLAFLVLVVGCVATAHAILGSGLTWRALAFVSLVVLGALPAGATLAGLRIVSMRGLTGTPGEQLAALMRLRRMLARVLQMMGSLLLVMVLVSAAAVGWGSSEKIPQSTAFVIGAAGSILIALVHVPTATLLRRRCQVYVDEFSDIAHVAKADLIAAAEDRIKLEEILGVNRTTIGELQSGLLIVGPLVATTIAAVIPKL